jgi:hypothetical protein
VLAPGGTSNDRGVIVSNEQSTGNYKPIESRDWVDQRVGSGKPIPTLNSSEEYAAMMRETHRTNELVQSETRKSVDSVQKDVRQFLPENKGR